METLNTILQDINHHLMQMKCKQCELGALELSCCEVKETIREAAAAVIQKIHLHEARLLSDVDTFCDTQYKKLGFSKVELDDAVIGLENGLSEEEDNISNIEQQYEMQQSAFSTCLGSLKELQQKFCHINFEAITIDELAFRDVRCNTAFGVLETVNCQSQNLLKSWSTLSTGSSEILSPADIKYESKSTKAKSKGDLHVSIDMANGTSSGLSSPIPSPGLGSGRRGKAGSRPTRMSLFQFNPLVSRHTSLENKAEECICSQDQPRAEHQWDVSTEGSKPGQLNCPNDVVFLSDNSLVVSDRENNRLQHFHMDGHLIQSIASRQIKPRRVAVKSNHILVTDAKDNCVKCYSLSGHMNKMWPKKFKWKFACPCGIATTSVGNVIVSDMESHTVSIQHMAGKQTKQIQCKHEFHSAGYITTDSCDRILVSDSWSQCVKAFDASGRYLFEFSSTSEVPDSKNSLKYPNGVCVDENDDIFVADWGMHTVSQFNQEGQFIRHVLTKADGILHPAGVAVAKGNLAVTAYSDNHSYLGLYKLPPK